MVRHHHCGPSIYISPFFCIRERADHHSLVYDSVWTHDDDDGKRLGSYFG